MKTLSSNTATAFDDPNVDIIRLCEVELDGLTLYLCDRVFGAAGSENFFNGQVYEPLVVSWGTVQAGKMAYPYYDLELSAAELVIDNNTPVGGADRLVGLLADYDFTYAPIKIFEIPAGASAAADAVDIFDGHVEDLLNMSAPQVTLTATGFEGGLSKKFDHVVLDADTYPNADPDDLGKMLPVPYGQVSKCPMLAVDVGGLTTLAEAVGADDVVFELTDGIDRFSAAGTGVIDDEEITWTGKSGKTLTGITRAANGTDAAEHKRGAMIGEKKDEYVFALGAAVSAVNDVYVADVRQPASEYTAYTGQSGDEHPDHAGKCCVVFDELSKILRTDPTSLSNNTEFEISRRVSGLPIGHVTAIDKNGVVAGFDDSVDISFPPAPDGDLSEIYVDYYFDHKLFSESGEMVMYPGGLDFFIDGKRVGQITEPYGSFHIMAGSPIRVKKDAWPVSAQKTRTFRLKRLGTYALVITRAEVVCTSTVSELAQQGKAVEKQAENLPVGAIDGDTGVDDAAQITFPAAPSGTLSDIMIEVNWRVSTMGDDITSDKPRVYYIGGHPVAIASAGGSFYGDTNSGTVYLPQDSWQTSIAKTPSRLDEFGRGEEFLITGAVQRCRTDDFSADYELRGNSMADAKLGGTVSADVDGVVDDGSGTITGTPGALIERPDHVAQHLLTVMCGMGADVIDSTEYAAAGSVYGAAGYKLAFPVLQPPSVPDLLGRIAHQAKSLQFWAAGEHHLVPYDSSASVDQTIYEHMIDLNQLHVKLTNRADMVNTATARYGRDWSGYSDDAEADRKTVTAEDAASVAAYGKLAGEERSYPYVPATGEDQAQDVLDWEIDHTAAQMLAIEFSGGYFLAALEQGDIVNFSFDAGDELDQALLGLVASETDKFIVVDRTDRPDGAKQFEILKLQ